MGTIWMAKDGAARTAGAQPPTPAPGRLTDALGRPLTDLRVSLTDRCNFRCGYCMPKEAFGRGHAYLPSKAMLSFEETARLAKIFVATGVRTIRLTGGEPLLRRGVEDLVAMLAGIAPGLDIAMTTNGSLLAGKARALKAAGLSRVTVSLDALDDAVFKAMNDVGFPVTRVLDGIDAAIEAGLWPVKVNMVVKKGVNEGQILPMARRFKGSGADLRLIEYMDVGSTNGWSLEHVLPSAAAIDLIRAELAIAPLGRRVHGETAERWGHLGDAGALDPLLGEIGLISSVSKAFCSDCSRARLSADGKLFACLFATSGTDFRGPLRSGRGDEWLGAELARVWSGRSDRYSELRALGAEPPTSAEGSARRVEMSFIGG